MLELERLTRRFGAATAVDDVSLTVRGGEMVGVIGRSGAGKSTLLRMVNRLTDPSEGRVSHGETDVTALRGRALRRWRRDCAMIFQQFNLVPRLDVLTNVMLGRLERRAAWANLAGRFSREERLQALDALDRLGVAETALQPAATLSGGQQQRVAIARALVQEPKLVLADEPIASLDPLNARLVMEALRDIHRAQGMTVLVNLHTLDTARRYCTRIVGMAAGRVVFDGTPDTLDAEAVRHVYGVEADDTDFSESATSSSIADPAHAGTSPAELASTNTVTASVHAAHAAHTAHTAHTALNGHGGTRVADRRTRVSAPRPTPRPTL